MNSIIVCGYSGIGKTVFAQKCISAVDIDSATIPKDDHFSERYMSRILAYIGQYEYILVSTHPKLRDALAKAGWSVVLVYPQRHLKREYLRRYLARGNSYAYAKLIERQWDEQIAALESETRFPAIVLSSGEYLSDCNLNLDLRNNGR